MTGHAQRRVGPVGFTQELIAVIPLIAGSGILLRIARIPAVRVVATGAGHQALLQVLGPNPIGREHGQAGGTAKAGGPDSDRVAVGAHPLLGRQLLLPVLLSAALIYLLAFVFWRQSKTDDSESGQPHLRNPFHISSALQFGLFLVMIMLLSHLMVHYFGNSGIYVLAAASGIADVDAITLSLTHMSLQQLPLDTAAYAILLAAVVNSIIKTGIAFFAGHTALGWRITAGLLLPLALALLII